MGGDAREVSERWKSKVIESVSSEDQRYTDRRIMIRDVTQYRTFYIIKKSESERGVMSKGYRGNRRS